VITQNLCNVKGRSVWKHSVTMREKSILLFIWSLYFWHSFTIGSCCIHYIHVIINYIRMHVDLCLVFTSLSAVNYWSDYQITRVEKYYNSLSNKSCAFHLCNCKFKPWQHLWIFAKHQWFYSGASLCLK
jgi:hypothetical protein